MAAAAASAKDPEKVMTATVAIAAERRMMEGRKKRMAVRTWMYRIRQKWNAIRQPQIVWRG
jgi:hypothetical protein